MPQHATEVAFIPIKPGTDLSTGDAQKIWNGTLRTITSQPGCQAMHWGREVERPDMVHLVVGAYNVHHYIYPDADRSHLLPPTVTSTHTSTYPRRPLTLHFLEWKSHHHHKAFMDSPGYVAFLSHLSPILSGDVKMYHIPFPADSSFSTAGSAAVTECISLFFEPSYPTSDYDKAWSTFVEQASKTAKEAQGIAGGWAIEEQRHAKLGEGGGEGPARLFGVFIGWPSVDAHMRYREQKEFKDVIVHLQDGPKALEARHVEFNRF